MRPALTPARQAGAWFTYPGGMEGWVDPGGWLHAEMVYLSADVDRDQRINHYTTPPPLHNTTCDHPPRPVLYN